ncbi:MAG: fumarylacetoacetate hydrolase family protein [Deltaproteobacteria bacterium]
MKIARYRTTSSTTPHYGILREGYIRDIVADPFEGMIVGTSEIHPLDEIRLLAPCTPTKIVALGLNYRDHAKELGMPLPDEPLIFLKPPSAVIGPQDAIRIPDMSHQVEHEAELAVVIGKRTRDISPEKAAESILGYTCLNDVTARDLQKKDVQFTRSKGFDTFCPFGPWIETEIDPSDLGITCVVNGVTRQDSRTSLLIHPVQEIVSFISRIMTLEPGDIIATGTPKGVGPLRPGDTVTVAIEGIGELTNFVT